MSQSIVMTLACYGTLEIVGVNYYFIIKTRTRYGVTPQPCLTQLESHSSLPEHTYLLTYSWLCHYTVPETS